MVKIYRQGDVLFKKIESLPKKKRKLDTDVIVKGEATGCAHRIVNGDIFVSWIERVGSVNFLKARLNVISSNDIKKIEFILYLFIFL